MSRARLASSEQRAAYRRWIRENHPDMGGDSDAFAVGLARYRTGRRPDRYDAPMVFVPDSDRIRRALRQFWQRLYRSDRAAARVR